MNHCNEPQTRNPDYRDYKSARVEVDIMRELHQRPSYVTVLAHTTGHPRQSVVRALKRLHESEMIHSQKVGNAMRYTLA